MAKSDLQAQPIYHRKRDSIDAHPTSVFAALAVTSADLVSLVGKTETTRKSITPQSARNT
jgi:hypothetical protein